MKLVLMGAILCLTLAACGGPAAPAGGSCNGGLCIQLSAVQPIRFGDAIVVNVTVKSEKQIPDLGVSVYTYPIDAVIDGPEGWEANTAERTVYKGGAGWKFAARAN